jgi:hypothetical protein
LFVLGHVGIGPRLLFGLQRRLPARWLIAGCLLPDLIDKPLFYALLWTRGTPHPLITGSRSIGHSGLFLIVLALAALISRRAEAWALAAGVVTHLLLDVGGELLTGARSDSSIWIAILFPALGWRFPVAHFDTLLEHLRLSAESLYVLAGEIVGGALLLRASRARRKTQSS